ncbi:hypothetical protein [Bacillus sp. Au-Bac7]|uniref:hypothetical protein n=1 Tax=Bacillus sp. Au-Bac7 TaxID=2906458 RepID=UPI001E3557AB|nr:hypothetical protein [Bacillus sp. Au-Bac7]MCE4051901.1 hypothetical protein [Bacillus sp. Au-Bac7]
MRNFIRDYLFKPKNEAVILQQPKQTYLYSPDPERERLFKDTIQIQKEMIISLQQQGIEVDLFKN